MFVKSLVITLWISAKTVEPITQFNMPCIFLRSFIFGKFNFGNIYFGGDAAHVHSPVGGRGMNLGIEDAFVFTELLIQNRLDEYNFVRGKAVKPTVERIFGITNILDGKTLFSKTL